MKSIFLITGQAFFLTLLLLQINVFAQNTAFDSGMKAAKSGDFQTALVYFQDSLDKNLPIQKQARIHYNIGACFYRMQQLDKAISELERAILMKDDYEKAFYALGMAYADSQKWTLAESAFQKTIKLAGGHDAEAWFDLAFVYVGRQNYDEAFKSFRNAVKYGSVAAAASHNNLGVIYAMKGNMKMAFKEIETAKNLGFRLATDNLQNLQKFISTGDRTSISKLIINKNDGQN